MDKTAHSHETTTEMPAAFREFLDEALPKDGGNHTLALGEHHASVEHIHWLRQHLPELQEKYGITTIGTEHLAAFNPVYWAYKDGTLSRALGSPAKVRAYVKAMDLSLSDDIEYNDNANAQSDLLMDAMDLGIRVVSYDGRDSWEITPLDSKSIRAFEKEWVTTKKIPPKIIRQTLRNDPAFLETIPKMDTHEQEAWFLGECAWLRSLSPAYETQMTTIEKLVAQGHKKIEAGKLTSDALSAVIFDAMASPTGNRLTIGGFNHINAVGDAGNYEKTERVHGTFGHHLFAMGQLTSAEQSHHVTRGVIATTAEASCLNKIEFELLEHPLQRAAIERPPFLFNLDTGKVGRMWHPPADGPKSVPLGEKFPTPDVLNSLRAGPHKERGREYHKKAHLDPMMLPDLRKKANAVRAAMNPELALDRPR